MLSKHKFSLIKSSIFGKKTEVVPKAPPQTFGTIIVGNVASGTVSFIDEEFSHLQKEVYVGKRPHEIVTSPDGNYAVVSLFGDIKGKHPGSSIVTLDVVNKKVINKFDLECESRPHGMCFMNNTKLLVASQGKQAIFMLDFAPDFNGILSMRKITLAGEGAHMVSIDKKREFAYVGNMTSGSVVKVNMHTFESQELKIGNESEAVTLSLDEKKLFVTDRKDDFIAVVDPEKMELIKKIPCGCGPTRVTIKDDKTAYINNTSTSRIQELDLEKLEIRATYPSSGNSRDKKCMGKSKTHGAFLGGLFQIPVNTTALADGSILVTNQRAGYVAKILDGNQIQRIEAGNQPNGLAYSNKPF